MQKINKTLQRRKTSRIGIQNNRISIKHKDAPKAKNERCDGFLEEPNNKLRSNARK